METSRMLYEVPKHVKNGTVSNFAFSFHALKDPPPFYNTINQTDKKFDVKLFPLFANFAVCNFATSNHKTTMI